MGNRFGDAEKWQARPAHRIIRNVRTSRQFRPLIVAVAIATFVTSALGLAAGDAGTDDGGWLRPHRTWRGPDGSTFGFQVFRGEERLELVVPKSFAGRSGDESRKIMGIELFNGARFTRIDGRVELRGTVSRMNFDYRRDQFEVILWESRHLRPGSNTCMECHGGDPPRTALTLGAETTELRPEPIERPTGRIRIGDAFEKSTELAIHHWWSRRSQGTFRLRTGHVQNGSYQVKARAWTLGFNRDLGRNWLIENQAIWSKTDTYPERRVFSTTLTWRLGRRLKLRFGGTAFLDGVTHFGTGMAELGQVALGLEKENSRFLPSLFEQLRDDAFGFYQTSVVYEYPF